VLGRAWGASVLVADIAKGSLATTTGRRLASDIGAVAAGVGTVLGHCFPPGRAGGKGVATRYGALVVVTPELAILDLVVAATVARLARKPDFAMTLSAVTSAVAGALALRLRATPRWSPVALAALSGAVVLVRFFQERVRRREIAGPGIT
jgi:glycerol-3-phosphate acyltransferase PlsY